jgi:hypothetical protein
MVEQLTIQTIGILLTGVSVSIAVIYYSMTLRNTNRIRKTQIITPLLSTIVQGDWVQDWIKLIWFHDFSSYEEWTEKYSPLVDSEAAKVYMTNVSLFNTLGLLLKENLIDPKLIRAIMTYSIPLAWEKCNPVIQGLRKRYNLPTYLENFEYLYNETQKLVSGFTAPQDLSKYERFE